MVMNATALFLLAAAAILGLPPATAAVDYGVDVSFPMHHATVSTNYPKIQHPASTTGSTPTTSSSNNTMVPQPLGDKQSSYEEFVKRCREYAGSEHASKCDESEARRIETNMRQPRAMRNFTETGYLKMRTPTDLMALLVSFYERNLHTANTTEPLTPGQTITNNFDVPTQLVNINNFELPGGGRALKQKVWDAASGPIREWTGQESLTPSSLYGVRIYSEGAILTPHVDRLPLISSAIINIAQDVDEPWPLEVIAHGGRAVNITMVPGDMVLYESHSIIHGRPYPLRGRSYANIFIHFMPSGDDGDDDLPIYLTPGSPQAEEWTRHVRKNERDSQGRTPLHEAAEKGDLKSAQRIVAFNAESVNSVDGNGWCPLHEAARSGHVDVASLLLENGADVNALTQRRASDGIGSGNGKGATPLYWAVKEWGKDHPIVGLLTSRGGVVLVQDHHQGGGGARTQNQRAAAADRTPLHLAAESGDLDVVRTIVVAAAAASSSSSSASVSSSDRKHLEAVVTARDSNGWQAIHEAARAGHSDVVEFLLDKGGADVNAETASAIISGGSGGTPLYWAIKKWGEDGRSVVQLLRERGGVSRRPRRLKVDENMRTALHRAADVGDMTTLRELVPANGGNKDEVNAGDVNGWRPLHEAARSGHAEAAQYLLDHGGADVNVRPREGKGGTALYYALARHGDDHPVVKLLKERGAVSVRPVI